MNFSSIEKYRFSESVEDKVNKMKNISKIYGINLREIDGYTMLSQKNKKKIISFLIDFMGSFDDNTKEDIIPIRVNEVEEVEYLGEDDQDDSCVKTLLHETYIINKDGTKKLLETSKGKKKESRITVVLKNNYIRFEYKLYGNIKHMQLISD